VTREELDAAHAALAARIAVAERDRRALEISAGVALAMVLVWMVGIGVAIWRTRQ
jgi:hypothetical protein